MRTTARTGCTRLLGAAAIAAGLALAQPAGAAPIAYSEPPDLNNFAGTPTLLGALDVGLNTVAGTIACLGEGCTRGDGFDYFNVTLAGGLRITGITIAVTDFARTGMLDGRFRNVGGTLGAAIGAFDLPIGSILAQTSVFNGAAAGPGDLTLAIQGFGIPVRVDTTASWAYLVGITVKAIPTTPVPEPASLALLGAGLLGLAATRRRRAG